MTHGRADGLAVAAWTSWSLRGTALDRPLAGATAQVVRHTDPFWFAWAAFYPDTELIAAA